MGSVLKPSRRMSPLARTLNAAVSIPAFLTMASTSSGS